VARWSGEKPGEPLELTLEDFISGTSARNFSLAVT
jgi:hypothetical protein